MKDSRNKRWNLWYKGSNLYGNRSIVKYNEIMQIYDECRICTATICTRAVWVSCKDIYMLKNRTLARIVFNILKTITACGNLLQWRKMAYNLFTMNSNEFHFWILSFKFILIWLDLNRSVLLFDLIILLR